MQFIGIIKRVIPFFLTFAAGLFIASFFITVATPSLEGVRNSRSERHGRKHCKSDNERLRAENERLKNELELMKQMSFEELELSVPPPPAIKEMKMKTAPVK